MRTTTKPTNEDQLIAVDEAAKMLGVSGMTIRRRIDEGVLPGYRIGPRVIRVRRDDVIALLTPVPVNGAE